MIPLLVPSAPFLQTERLDLWLPQVGDRPALRDLIADNAVNQFLGPPQSEADHFVRLLRNAGSWALYGYGFCTVRPRGEGNVIGTCGVFRSFRGFPGKNMDDVPEAGWIFAPQTWGQGLAREAMEEVLAWFDKSLGRQRITCMIEEGNDPSLRLAQRLGFARYDLHQADDGAPLILLERQ